MEDPSPKISSTFSPLVLPANTAPTTFTNSNSNNNLGASSVSLTNDKVTYNYEHVLSTITDLQQELEKTIRVACSLKDENELLRRNYNDVQQSLCRTQKRLKEARSTTNTPQDPTTSMLQEKEESLMQCRAQLDQCTKDLQVALEERNAAIKACEDTVRNRLKEELFQIENSTIGSSSCSSHPGSKVSLLEKEVEKWRGEYYQLRKNSEHYKATQQSNMDVISERELVLEGEITALSSALEKLVQGRTCCVQSCDRMKEVAILELQLKDQDTILTNLRTQLSKAQKERDQQELANIALLARHQEDLMPMTKHVTILDADKKLLEKQHEGLQVDLKQLHEVNAELRERIVALNKEKDKPRLEESARFCKEWEAREAELLEDYKRRESKFVSRIKNIENQMDLLKKEKQEAIQALSTEKQLTLEQQKQKCQNTEKLLEASDKAVKQLRQQIMDNKAQFVQFETDFKGKELEYLSLIEKLRHDCELHRITAERITTEKEAIVRRAVAAEKKSEQMKASLMPIQQELTLKAEENEDVTNQLKVAQQRISDLENARDVTLAEATRGKEDLESLKKSNEDKLSAFQTKMGFLSAELAREKKLSKCYKEKAIDAHKKTRLAKQTLERCYVPFGAGNT